MFCWATRYKAFQGYDKNFPFLVGGAPMWAFKESLAGFEALRGLFMDPSKYRTAYCTFATFLLGG